MSTHHLEAKGLKGKSDINCLTELFSHNINSKSSNHKSNIYHSSSLMANKEVRVGEDKNDFQLKPYIVKRGDTLTGLSRLYGINKNYLIRINNIKNPNVLYPGQLIMLYDSKVNPRFHIVQKGETLYKISQYYNVDLVTLRNNNNILEKSTIKPGQRIIILSDPVNALTEINSSLSNSNLEYLNEKYYLDQINDGLSEWRNYGSLKVNWSSWKKYKANSIGLAKNKNGDPILLAINCNSTSINWKIPSKEWDRWFTPANNYEFKLIEDLCENAN
ncbi:MULTISPECIES: LysM peptidoglycan-binding domain-containing protein [unclassified Prochlorococcus]|uniref:LysM peptidoglycan-binding domain-containing protein n=1 Tax=unclassified Prochlorococcus TaxID=2627481 RepID=UPI0005669F88|nr:MULTISPECIES: LysM peptidoglycan-binding domain-containing protein [unclassified Prochlorococcus]